MLIIIIKLIKGRGTLLKRIVKNINFTLNITFKEIYLICIITILLATKYLYWQNILYSIFILTIAFIGLNIIYNENNIFIVKSTKILGTIILIINIATINLEIIALILNL